MLRAAQVVDPILDVLAEADPLGLREHTRHLGGPAGGALGKAEDAFAWAPVGDRLPLQDLFGFTSQAIVLCAVAREHGISDHQQQVRLLAAVLSGRDVTPERDEGQSADPPPSDSSALLGRRPVLPSRCGVL